MDEVESLKARLAKTEQERDAHHKRASDNAAKASVLESEARLKMRSIVDALENEEWNDALSIAEAFLTPTPSGEGERP